jgi:hypothetical protein
MAHATVAVNKSVFQSSLELLKRNFELAQADTEDFGPFRLGYDVKAHLEDGTFDLRADNTVELKELDLRWDRLKVILGLDIPGICVGGGCVDLPWPLPDFCLPRWCLFEDDPDVSVELDFAALVAQEVSLTGSLVVRYYDAGVPAPAIDPCALLRVVPLPPNNRWDIHLDPQSIDLDLFDFPDVVGNLFEDALTGAVEALIPGGIVRDLLLAIIGSVADLIRDVLDIPDEIDEWLSDFFNVSFGLFDLILQVVGDFFSSCNPLYGINDPLEVLPASGALIPVRIPIANVAVHNDADEMVIEADVGA